MVGFGVVFLGVFFSSLPSPARVRIRSCRCRANGVMLIRINHHDPASSSTAGVQHTSMAPGEENLA